MNKNVEKGFAKIIGNMYDEALKEAQKRDDCRYCHKPFECLGGVANHDAVCTVQLNELLDDEENVIKFCPVCGRDLSVESYVDRMQKARKESGEAIKEIDGLLKVKK
ncbi:hypothetical protein [Pediococcus acidilactici]|uniref:hypothetical protein n=1 Tax=Pediococcus acidilactici TaxID=1254 RepID=UPI00132587B6|nr:hypothetical protein [Pediococcus acidilactici]KAF0339769.1 hypothetical protein GBO40_04315 [Pediococcus acidilactici]KAF0379732.1 hypothetical protein GBO63_04300 [Pediococcus acidilactici]KAF0388419.1 hypothetical protein GBO66_08395 [Pediococcus acidilactici]KAF0452972.1 hypothetical protein GBO98_04360 [Pediococcus acidilactici]KAF0462251.1 hypothetical protein GBP00_02535 [Pediococcus acidilactici]